MPPTPDKNLEERILKAAQSLWRIRGEKGLTLRAVAREAGTTTPTLYKRFRNKQALRLALASRFREELTGELLASATIEEVHRRYLGYVGAHPREYDLLGASWGHFFSSPRPARAWMATQLATRFGGQPEDYFQAFDAIFLLCHGTSSLLTMAPNESVFAATHEICIKVCDRLLQNAALLRGR